MAFNPVIHLPGTYPKEIVKDTKHSVQKESKTIYIHTNREMLHHSAIMLLQTSLSLKYIQMKKWAK